MRAFDGRTPIEDIVAFADGVRATPAQRDELIALLPEQSPVYAGRGANEAARLRGYFLASFEATGLPPAAVVYVIEELESGIDPYAIAAAAKALRGAQHLPERIVPLLLQAIERIRLSDDLVCLDRWSAGLNGASSTSALIELFRSLAWLGPRAAAARERLAAMAAAGDAAFSSRVRSEMEKAVAAVSRVDPPAGDCCSGPAERPLPVSAANPASSIRPSEEDISSLEMQDQHGDILSYAEFFHGRPSVVAFFYTRCMNPNKCSLTIMRIAQLQRRLATEGMTGSVNVAAVTYDPAFDLPRRLQTYGTDRGMMFDARNRMLRTTGGFERLQRRFDLGVGYGEATVNQHRSELFVLDKRGDTIFSVTRRQWQEDEVVGALKDVLTTA